MTDYRIALTFLNQFWTAFKNQMLEEASIGDIGAGIRHAIEPRILVKWQIGSFDLILSDVIVVSWVVMIFIFVIAWFVGRNRASMPSKTGQILSEGFVNMLLNLCQNSGMTYDQAERVVPFVGTIGIFITFTNLSSLFRIPPPAKNPAFPIALALMTILYVIIMSIRLLGLRGFWTSLIYPKAMLLPFRILDFMIKPISLSLRLFGNVFGAYILMEFIFIIVPVLIPGVLGLWFDLADGIIQGAIFIYLTIMYIGEIVEGANEAEHEKKIRQSVHV